MEDFSFSRKQWIALWTLPIIICGWIFTAQVRGYLMQRHTAAAEAQQEAYAEAVQAATTTFPQPKEVGRSMAIYRVAGFGITGYNADTTYVSATRYDLSPGHYLIYADPNFGSDNRWLLCRSTFPQVADVDYIGGSDASDPTNGAYTQQGPDPTIGTVTEVVVDTTAPTYDSSETTTDGTKVLVNLTEADSPPVLPATGVTGFTVKVNGVARTVTSATASSTTITLNVSGTIYDTDTVTVEYDDGSGNVTDSASTPNAMASFGAQAVTNNSTEEEPDTTKPTIDSATVSSGSPNKLSMSTTESDSPPITGSSSGLALSGLLHGPATLSNYNITSGNITADISRNLYSDETAVKLSYTPGDLADSADTPNAMAAFSDLAVTNNSTQEYVPMPITFTIDTGANKSLAKPTSSDEDVTIAQTQQGSDGKLAIPARIPMLNKNFSTRMAEDIDNLDAADPLDKSMMVNFDLSALVNPIWFFDENEETFQSHVDGEEPQRTIGLRVSQSSSDLSTLKGFRSAQPATPRWYQLRGVHADNSKYSFKAEYYASPSAAVTLGAGNNVRYVEFPMATVISGKGFAMRFKVTEPE